MQYNSVISVISKCFKNMAIKRTILNKSCLPYLPFYYEYIFSNTKCSKIIYNVINKNCLKPTAISKWNSELSPHGVNDICTQDVFRVCFKTTNDSSV